MKSVISVKLKEGCRAELVLYKTNEKNKSETILKCEALIGKNGLGKTIEGDNKTPVGEFGLLYAFGIKPNPGTKLKYLQITDSHYACNENCEFYNKIIDINVINHKCKGEHIIDFVPIYNYGIVLDYNKQCIYPNGSAIFLHCNGKKEHTYGCISVAEKNMITILSNIEIDTKIIVSE